MTTSARPRPGVLSWGESTLPPNDMKLRCRNRTLDLAVPAVMGVLNVTPDSFSDGGRHFARAAAIDAGLRMREEGASILDVGGESTRPGAAAVGVEEELDRVLPVIQALVARSDAIVSVDTSKPEVMRAALDAGAHLINDVRALQLPGALATAAAAGAAVCLMHMQGEPRSMQDSPRYSDVVGEVREFLRPPGRRVPGGGRGARRDLRRSRHWFRQATRAQPRIAAEPAHLHDARGSIARGRLAQVAHRYDHGPARR